MNVEKKEGVATGCGKNEQQGAKREGQRGTGRIGRRRNVILDDLMPSQQLSWPSYSAASRPPDCTFALVVTRCPRPRKKNQCSACGCFGFAVRSVVQTSCSSLNRGCRCPARPPRRPQRPRWCCTMEKPELRAYLSKFAAAPLSAHARRHPRRRRGRRSRASVPSGGGSEGLVWN